jgi:peptidoglycan/xylan/chitin deacetylase (PgdA/CDA1 family)
MRVLHIETEVIPTSVSPKVLLDKKAEHPKQIALTFDDGPHPKYTEQILDGLAKRKVKATFFVLGRNVTGKEEIVKRIYKEGHLIGNHTYNHVRLTSLRLKTGCEELNDTNQCIYDITGMYPNYVRPPFGAWRDGLDCEVNMIPVMWTIDSRDWVLKNTDEIVNNVVKKVKEGDIILMHDWYATSVEAAMEIVDQLQEQNYDFVTVDELL